MPETERRRLAGEGTLRPLQNKMDKSTSQLEKVREHLLSGRSITPIEALDNYGSFRLGALIFTLRKQGMRIRTDLIPHNGSHFAMYTLEKEEEFTLT